MLSVGAEYFVFQFALQKYEGEGIRKYNLPLVLYGCETFSLTPGENLGWRVFENGVLRKIFGSKRG
jgi:hypothetical protein